MNRNPTPATPPRGPVIRSRPPSVPPVPQNRPTLGHSVIPRPLTHATITKGPGRGFEPHGGA